MVDEMNEIFMTQVDLRKCVTPKWMETLSKVQDKNAAHLLLHNPLEAFHTKTDRLQGYIQTVASIVGTVATIEDTEVMSSAFLGICSNNWGC